MITVRKSIEHDYTVKCLIEANKFIYASSPVLYLCYMTLSLIEVAGVAVSLFSVQFTTNAIFRVFNGTSTGLQYEITGIALFCLAAVVIYMFNVAKGIILQKIRLDATYRFEKTVCGKLGRVQWDCLEEHATSVKIHEVSSSSLNAMFDMLGSTYFYLFSFFSVALYTFFLSQINIIMVVIYLGLVLLANKLSNKRWEQTRGIWDEVQPLAHKENYFFGISGDKVSHQEYKFNRLFPFVRDRWSRSFEEQYKLRMKIFGKHEITLQLARVILNTPYILMTIWVSYEIVNGKHDIGFLMLCMGMFNNIVNTFGSVQYYIGNDKVQSKFMNSFLDIVRLPDEPLVSGNRTVAESVSFHHVDYTYPQAERKALDGFSLRLRQGEKIAVVGHNGSGKTTFTNLLTALASRYDGDITADGLLSDERFSIIRNSVSCILQDFAQYQMSIRDNIQAGYVARTLTDEEIWALLRKSGLAEFVGALRDGIDTPLGQLDGGIELSKGQWQRLAIARLLANPHANIWVLDEPTAYLDPLAEIEMYDMIYELAGHRTVLFISHRLGFAKRAERIIVFDNGMIAEEGTHHELVRHGGIYAEMYKNQESWYTPDPSASSIRQLQ